MPRVLDADDRLELLTTLARRYPEYVPLTEMGIEDAETLSRTLAYLEEKHLVTLQSRAPNNPGARMTTGAKLTASGYDVVEQSGAFEGED